MMRSLSSDVWFWLYHGRQLRLAGLQCWVKWLYRLIWIVVGTDCTLGIGLCVQFIIYVVVVFDNITVEPHGDKNACHG